VVKCLLRILEFVASILYKEAACPCTFHALPQSTQACSCSCLKVAFDLSYLMHFSHEQSFHFVLYNICNERSSIIVETSP
jgi:hypothetical protein